ncbi:glycosyltransferase [Zunongwangia sp.]|uniref:glycosyltransferase n=1 Tax=Zunongwangia sp. TaxID=1965325 RepID=UPI003AA89D75
MSVKAKKLLVIGYVWPEPESSAAGSRMLQLLQFFLSNNFEITFATTAKDSNYRFEIESLGIKTAHIELNKDSFNEFASSLQPNIVLFDRFMMEEQFGWRIEETCPNAIKILDTEDLHFLRNARKKALQQPEKFDSFLRNSDLAKREIAAIYRCDISLIIADFEMEILQKSFAIPPSILHYLPYALSEKKLKITVDLPNFDKRSDFVFIGNFLHEPNWNAVLHLKNKIWPEIRKKSLNANLLIYGAYPSSKVYNLHNEKEGFLIKGRAEQAFDVLKTARILLAPLQFGAGLKGKFVDAMQTGTPSVTTSIGVEGITSAENWNGFVTDNDIEFVEKAIELYTNENLWNQKSKKGPEILNSRFSASDLLPKLREKIEVVSSNLDQHRLENFTGSMLKFHYNRSTYFMSKYIAEKEENRAKGTV